LVKVLDIEEVKVNKVHVGVQWKGDLMRDPLIEDLNHH